MHETERDWFTNNYIDGRQLSGHEKSFLSVLKSMLDRVKPAQVVPKHTHLIAEGTDRLIAIIPHEALAGLSIVVWIDPDDISVSWAQIADLSATHDDIDIGHWVGRFKRIESIAAWYDSATECIEEQLSRLIQVSSTYRAGETQPVRTEFLLDQNDRARRLGWVGKRGGRVRRLLGLGWRADVQIVRFTDPQAPLAAYPIDVTAWYRTGRNVGGA